MRLTRPAHAAAVIRLLTPPARRPARRGVILALLAVLAAGMPAAAGTTPGVWGWVTARQPTTAAYTPGARDQGSSDGVSHTVERLQRGRYKLTLGGLAHSCSGTLFGYGCNGNVQVTPIAGQSRLCVPGELYTPTSGDVEVEVYCFDRRGRRADSAFSMNYLAAGEDHGSVAYLWADQPDTEQGYEPALAYNYTSGAPSAVNEAIRAARGAYHFVLVGMRAASEGNVQVVAGGIASCKVRDWRALALSPDIPLAEVRVACRDLDGDAHDSSVWLVHTVGVGLKGVGGSRGEPAAYLWADRPTTASYRPEAAHRFSSAGVSPVVTRSAVGTYSVKLRGLPSGGSAQVTAFGTGKAACQLSDIRRTGIPQRIGVLCFRPDGSRVDSRFLLTFTR